MTVIDLSHLEDSVVRAEIVDGFGRAISYLDRYSSQLSHLHPTENALHPRHLC